MKLKLGIMTNQELADWFGVKEQTFRSTKRKKLEELKKFAEYEISGSKINIIRIYKEEYDKLYHGCNASFSQGPAIYQLVKSSINSNNSYPSFQNFTDEEKQFKEQLFYQIFGEHYGLTVKQMESIIMATAEYYRGYLSAEQYGLDILDILPDEYLEKFSQYKMQLGAAVGMPIDEVLGRM